MEERQNGTLGLVLNIGPQHQFESLLIRPAHRIYEYPLLLNRLLQCTDQAQNPHVYTELEAAIASIERVTIHVNEAKRRQENILVRKDLEARAVNWNEFVSHELGNLLLSETFPVLMESDKESIFQCYLFETTLMCCRDDSLKDMYKKSSRAMNISKRGKTGRMGKDLSVPARGPLYLKECLNIRHIRQVYVPQY